MRGRRPGAIVGGKSRWRYRQKLLTRAVHDALTQLFPWEDMMQKTEAPTREQLVQRASELVPLLAKHAAWSEENRRLHEESIEALADAGIFRMRVPVRY